MCVCAVVIEYPKLNHIFVCRSQLWDQAPPRLEQFRSKCICVHSHNFYMYNVYMNGVCLCMGAPRCMNLHNRE